METTGRLLLSGEVRLLSMRIKNNPMGKKWAGRQGPPGPLLGVPGREGAIGETGQPRRRSGDEGVADGENPERRTERGRRNPSPRRGHVPWTVHGATGPAELCPTCLGFHVTATSQGRMGDGADTATV